MSEEIRLQVDLDALTIDDLADLDRVLRNAMPLAERIAFYKRVCPTQSEAIGKMKAKQVQQVAAQILRAIGAYMNPADGTGKNSTAGSGITSGPEPAPSQ